MLAVGIDWSEEFHLVALGRPGEGVFDVGRVEHSPKAVDALCARIAGLEPDPAEVRVVLEARHGLLVERLLDAGVGVAGRELLEVPNERGLRERRRHVELAHEPDALRDLLIELVDGRDPDCRQHLLAVGVRQREVTGADGSTLPSDGASPRGALPVLVPRGLK